MLLSSWLSQHTSIGIYPHEILHDLAFWGITYQPVSGHLLGSGVLVRAPRMTERALLAEAARTGWTATINKAVATDYWVLGYGMADALALMLAPFTAPSLALDPQARFETAVVTLITAGY